jgi:hypothetical protein
MKFFPDGYFLFFLSYANAPLFFFANAASKLKLKFYQILFDFIFSNFIFMYAVKWYHI